MTWLFAIILLLVGGGLAYGGILLAAAGGSWYYVVTGVAVLVAATGFIRRARYAYWAYGAMLAGTIVWGLWEAGLNNWGLMPRLVAPAVVGLLLLLPPMHRAAGARRAWIAVPALAALALVGAAIVRAETAESGLPPAARIAVSADAPTDWRHWGNALAGTRYAAIDQINLGNVRDLELAWHFDSDLPPGELPSLQAAPLAVDGRLYVCLQSGTVAALDQDSGKQIWRFDSMPRNSPLLGWKCRGVAYHADEPADQDAARPAPARLSQAAPRQRDCVRRIFLSAVTGDLIAIDADTGRPCSGFGENGRVDLKIGMGLTKPDEALPTSPPTVVNGVVVVGQSISDFESFTAPSGVIRGYDARTGALRWAWDVGRPGKTQLEPGETYTRDTPNAWGVFSGDEALGLVYIGTGNSPPDYYSGFRSKIADEFTDNIVAIDVATGLPRWRFKTVNHDL
ncbi:PQQ-binding-like beta-propeller repeat protein [Blastomonas sp.]|uniref:outer membrane protein assembly factor BamB family protein n=1 Tax=Blastomonas sp. TaxID=1909299 RepID=UPI00391A1BCE